MRVLFIAIVAWALSAAASAAQPSLNSGSVMEAAQRLKPGEFLWAPEVAPRGPVLLIVSLATQRAVIYRNGVPIGISTVSTGRPGFRTPTGVFTVLQRRVEHYSNLYDDAPMPYMQRLTWGGVALHAGNLPGYPASHGCIRLPHDFARLLYGVTHLGMTVVVTDRPVVPRIAPAEQLLSENRGPALPGPAMKWQPERSRSGPVSVVVSTADSRVVVLRDGKVIGSSPVVIQGPIARTTAYVLQADAGPQRRWLRIALPGQTVETTESQLRGRIEVPEEFRRNVEEILAPGTTVVVTPDSLRTDESGGALTIVESED